MSETGSLLIVDDVEDNLQLLSLRLVKRGYKVTIADGGQKALDMIEAQEFDLIVLDIMMPEVDGYEVLKSVRQHHSISELPVIMATAKTESIDIIKALQIGANDYVTKPIDFPVLLARIQTHLALKRLATLKDEFLHIAAHELKNPLWSVLTAVEMIKDDTKPGDVMSAETYKMLNMIERQAEEMQRIVVDFLDFQALEENQISLNREMVSLNELVRQSVENNQIYAARKEIGLRLNLEEDLPMVEADRLRLSQVIQNLLGNALKFGSRGNAPTYLRTRSEGDNVFLEVCDAGPGLTEDDLTKVFQRYSRLSNKPTGGERSSGLGLAICKQIVNLQGGEINVHNNPERGATFWFRLPAKRLE